MSTQLQSPIYAVCTCVCVCVWCVCVCVRERVWGAWGAMHVYKYILLCMLACSDMVVAVYVWGTP